MSGYPEHAIAVIGLTGRFPGAADVGRLWDNVLAGRDTISRFGRAEMAAAGVAPELLADHRYVGARGVLADADQFDAGFFRMSPREAAITDPQHRVFLEAAWEALEIAGYPPGGAGLLTGVYASAGPPTYLTGNVIQLRGQVSGLEALLGNDKDYLASRVAYKLDLRGPAISVQTACSSSLVAVGLACQALQAYDCDLALAGGVSVRLPQISGYPWRSGDIMSSDGTCRPFDAGANGTVLGNAVGVLVLRRLGDAVEAGDYISAVLTGHAVTNDGARKAGFTAPGVDGQRRAILLAQARAGRTADDIGYVEAHGTGTEVGDVIELTALTEAFRATTSRTGFCQLGAVKANIGHTDAAAGAAGLIKTIMSVREGVIPPLAHFTAPGADIHLQETPFRVPTTPRSWPQRRVAAVSSFGIGGTNAHVIVEQAPPPRRRPGPGPGPGRPAELLVLSARAPAALREQGSRLAAALDGGTDALADVAYTLAVGRSAHDHRWSAACSDRAEALARLAEPIAPPPALAAGPARVAWLFPGGGAQYPGMAAELYAGLPDFRAAFDECAAASGERLGVDIRALPLRAPAGDAAGLQDGAVGLPALFATEYALARTFAAWGIRPAVLGGHSLGEYTAATLAGVFTVADAMELVGVRGALLDKSARGAMLAVQLPPDALEPLLPPGVSIAAHNGPASCVISGLEAGVSAVQRRLADIGVRHRRVPIAVAAHSALVDPVLADFRAAVARVPRQAPELPIVSNRSGTWLTAQEATSADYWVGHLRDTVRFADGLATLARSGATVLLELGPGHTLTTLAKALPGTGIEALSTLPGSDEPHRPLAGALEALGRLWRAGLPVSWDAVYQGRHPRRVPLPTYPWQRQRHWIEAEPASRVADAGTTRRAAGSAPLTGSAPAAGGQEPAAGGQEPTPLLDEVAALWSAALGVGVGPDDNFFVLGGQSLAGLRLVNELAERFSVPLTLRMLFDHPTVAQLGDVIAALGDPPGNGRRLDQEAR